ncbi:MAG: TonB-dependent receptor [Methylovirgula sp.]
MFRVQLSRGVSTLALCVPVSLLMTQAFAQSSNPTQELAPVEVTAEGSGATTTAAPPRPASAVPANVPAVIEGISAKTIDVLVNAITSAEALKYLPSIEVRERYIGDRNGIVATRTTGTVSSAESLVYADGLLISNLLGNSYSYPPRWQMVTPQEIQRIDVIYGPFSALYPGNSMGGVVVMTTRMPEKLEIHAALKGFNETFNLYGVHEQNPGLNGSFSIGDRIEAFSFWLSYDHLDAQGHPMSFATAETTATTKTIGTPVTGAYSDIDQTGVPRYVFGAYSIDHTLQDTGKVKLAYDFTPVLRASYVAGLWTDDSHTTTQTFLTDAAGNPIYNTANGVVSINGVNYKLSGLDPGYAAQTHLMQGVELKSTTGRVFDFDAVASSYNFLRDISLTANDYGVNTTGTNTTQTGTGWQTLDLRGIWRPQVNALGSHEVSFGTHADEYKLEQYTFNTALWSSSTASSLLGSSLGKTSEEALYVQDVWSFLPRWKLTLGGREEFWQAFDGSNMNTKGTLDYPSLSATDFSPKGSLSYQAAPDLLFRGSVGKAYRFPTVTELYQQVTNSQSIIVNDPNLLPEQVMSYDFTTEYTFGKSLARLSFFQEDRWNALFSQTDTTVTPNVTEVENIGKIRIQGIETALNSNDVLIKGLDLGGSVTYADSRILSDYQNAAVVGGNWPRIPRWRARATALYRPDEKFSVAVGVRYASGAYSLLNNTDINHDTYGGISSYLVADARLTYKMSKNWSMAFGIDNIGNYKYYVSPHPYPQRTLFAEMRYDY